MGAADLASARRFCSRIGLFGTNQSTTLPQRSKCVLTSGTLRRYRPYRNTQEYGTSDAPIGLRRLSLPLPGRAVKATTAVVTASGAQCQHLPLVVTQV